MYQEADGAAICVKEYELRGLLDTIGKRPAMVITDSQVFAKVSADVPEEIPLTSFSILMARYKGFLEEAVLGAAAIDRLKDGDRILISEGCTHHRQCDDIGSVQDSSLAEKLYRQKAYNRDIFRTGIS